MPILIVYFLEVIEIEKYDAVRFNALIQLVQLLLKRPFIQGIRQRIQRCHSLIEHELALNPSDIGKQPVKRHDCENCPHGV